MTVLRFRNIFYQSPCELSNYTGFGLPPSKIQKNLNFARIPLLRALFFFLFSGLCAISVSILCSIRLDNLNIKFFPTEENLARKCRSLHFDLIYARNIYIHRDNMESQSTFKIDNEALFVWYILNQKSYIREWIAFSLLTYFTDFTEIFLSTPTNCLLVTLPTNPFLLNIVCRRLFSLAILNQKLTEKRSAFVRRPALVVNTI